MRFLLSTALAALCLTQLAAQPLTGERADHVVAGAAQVTLHPESGKLMIATFEDGTANVVPEDAAQWLKAALRIEGDLTFEFQKVQSDKSGMRHARYRQLYSGIPIENSAVTLHIKAGDLQSFSGVYHIDLTGVPVSAGLSANDAIDRAKAHTRSGEFMWADDEFPDPDLVILPKGDEFILAYKTDIYSLNPLSESITLWML